MTAIDFPEGGRFVLVPQTPDMQNKVVALALTSKTPCRIRFMSGEEEVIAAFYLAANAPLVLPWVQNGWFETLPGQELSIEIGPKAARVSGVFSYGVSQ
jgi:hypothetical protein